MDEPQDLQRFLHRNAEAHFIMELTKDDRCRVSNVRCMRSVLGSIRDSSGMWPLDTRPSPMPGSSIGSMRTSAVRWRGIAHSKNIIYNTLIQ